MRLPVISVKSATTSSWARVMSFIASPFVGGRLFESASWLPVIYVLVCLATALILSKCLAIRSLPVLYPITTDCKSLQAGIPQDLVFIRHASWLVVLSVVCIPNTRLAGRSVAGRQAPAALGGPLVATAVPAGSDSSPRQSGRRHESVRLTVTAGCR